MYKTSRQNSARIVLSAAMLAALAGSATAADLGTRPLYQPPPPPPPVFSWTGCYVGANVGGGWASKRRRSPAVGAWEQTGQCDRGGQKYGCAGANGRPDNWVKMDALERG